MNLISRPYNLLGLMALALLVSSFFVSNETIDIHLHDTYFIIALKQIIWVSAGLMVFFWILYRLTNHILLSRFLTWAHVILSILTVILIPTISWLASKFYIPGEARRYYDNTNWESFNSFERQITITFIVIIILLVGQLFYVINIIGGVVKGKN